MLKQNSILPENFDVKATPLTGAYLFNELISTIDNSKLFVYSIQYQWKWNIHERFSRVQQLGTCIAKSIKRNVEVKVILNTESPGRNLSKINSVTFDSLNRLGAHCKLLKAYSLLHTKLWIIDSKYTFIGSHNISGRSLCANEEVSVKIESENFAKFMLVYFDNLWNVP